GLPIQPVAPPSPDYIPGPEDLLIPPVPQDEDKSEPMFVQAHDPDFVPEPVYPEYMPLEDEHLDPEEDPEEDDNEDPKEDPADYPANEGDDGDDEDESSDDDKDKDVDIEGDEGEEEHPAPAELLLYQLLIMPHLLRRLSRLRLTSLRPHHHHILHTGLLLGYRSEMSHLHPYGLIQRLPDSLLYLLYHYHHFPHGHHHYLRFPHDHY
ncbi:hypothetical protein Tco_1159876, partial [Tanacetum coccineum]